MAIPFAAVEEVRNKFNNTLYGYFIGKRLAFPLVEKYVKNTWAKFGLERVMLHNGFFFFQFATREGMERVLENGPWLIRLVPLILNIWSPNSMLKKDEITLAPVWVKLHNMPIVAYSETGLSLITTKLGRPIMLDAYTSDMCLNPWGRNTYARALIEVSAAQALLNSLVVAIPLSNGKGHTLETIEIEYEWQPPRCEACRIFDHTDIHCPKKVKVNEVAPKGPVMAAKSSTMEVNEDGFVEVKDRKKKVGDASRYVNGFRMSQPTTKVNWQQKKSTGSKGNSNNTSFSGTTNGKEKEVGSKISSAHAKLETSIPVSNPFVVLNVDEEDGPNKQNPLPSHCVNGSKEAIKYNNSKGTQSSGETQPNDYVSDNSKEAQSFGETQQNDYVSAQPDDQNTNNVENNSRDDDDGIGAWGEDKQVINKKHQNPSYNPSVDGHRKNKKTIEDVGFTTGTYTDGKNSQVAMDLARLRQKVTELKGNLNIK